MASYNDSIRLACTIFTVTLGCLWVPLQDELQSLRALEDSMRLACTNFTVTLGCLWVPLQDELQSLRALEDSLRLACTADEAAPEKAADERAVMVMQAQDVFASIKFTRLKLDSLREQLQVRNSGQGACCLDEVPACVHASSAAYKRLTQSCISSLAFARLSKYLHTHYVLCSLASSTCWPLIIRRSVLQGSQEKTLHSRSVQVLTCVCNVLAPS